jgi:tRNA A-37 threonylcarbamoyl transferase component Bud32/tetratricopeptide (TPR) repeat protein
MCDDGAVSRPEYARDEPSTRLLGPDDPGTRILGASDPTPPPAPIPVEIATVVVGRYTVLDHVGDGGMGSVVRAYDAKLRREVALKRLRVDTCDPAARARLLREAQAMAQLSHPNVVAVHDVEAESATRLWLVMEYVDGETLRAWTRRPHSWAAIVDVLARAGEGLAAAHREGIVHRDFKPSNVLVAGDAASVVKVADFGLAKFGDGVASGSQPALDSVSRDFSSEEALTEAGMVMGTPRYMSPEQHAGAQVDARTDQFALCVALWEALHDRPPYETPQEKRRGPPPWTRADVPRRIAAAIQRGLSPDPGQRWPDLPALLAELRPRSAARSRSALALAAGAIALVAGAAWWGGRALEPCAGAEDRWIGVWDDATRAELTASLSAAARGFGADTAQRIAGTFDEFRTDWLRGYGEACEATNVRAEQSAEVMDLRMECLRQAQRDFGVLREVLRDADEETVARADRMAAELPRLDRCADVTALRAEVPPPHDAAVASEVEIVRRGLRRVETLNLAQRFEAAEHVLDDLPGPDDDIAYAPLRTELLLLNADVAERRGDTDAAIAMQRRALESGMANNQWSAALKATLRLAFVTGGLRRERDAAEAYLDMARALLTRPGLTDLHASWVHSVHADVLHRLGDHETAEHEYLETIRMREEVYGPRAAETARARTSLGVLYYTMGRFDDAQAQLALSVTDREAALGRAHPDTLSSRTTLAALLMERGEYAEAEAEMREVYEARLASASAEDPEVVTAASNLAAVLSLRRKYDDAVALLEPTLQKLAAAGQSARPDGLVLQDNYAIALSEVGRADEAIVVARAIVARWVEVDGERSRTVARARYVLGDLLRKADQPAEAEGELRAAVAAQEATGGADLPEHPPILVALGRTLEELGRAAEARTVLRDAWTKIEAFEIARDVRGECAFALARVLALEPATRAEGIELARIAHAAFASTEGVDSPASIEVRAWLEQHG